MGDSATECHDEADEPGKRDEPRQFTVVPVEDAEHHEQHAPRGKPCHEDTAEEFEACHGMAPMLDCPGAYDGAQAFLDAFPTKRRIGRRNAAKPPFCAAA